MAINSKNYSLRKMQNNGITTPFDYTGLTVNTDWIDAVNRTAKYSAST
jgi:hypothetical protein